MQLARAILLFVLLLIPQSAFAEEYFVFWVKSFIPIDVKDAKKIPGRSTSLISFPVGRQIIGCFETDNRGFSKNIKASARLTAVIRASKILNSHTFERDCGVSRRVNCDNGVREGAKRCNSSDAIKISYRMIERSRHEYRIIFEGRNPFAPPLITPAIDIDLTLIEEWSESKLILTLNGKVDAFPAFEAYARYKNKTKRFFAFPPTPGSTPLNLYGDANRPVTSRRIVFDQ